MITPAQTLGGLSEEGLLGSIFPFFTPQPGLLVGPGDDAAVVAASGPVVATTDAMVRGRDWLDQWSSASDVGSKLLTQNLADLAAMGAVGTSVLITLVADPATPVAWARDFAKAVGEGAALARVAVAGGDLSSAPPGVLLVSITALGDLQGRAPVLRSGARPGHTVAVCGPLGRSAAGLRLLETGGDQASDGDQATDGEQGSYLEIAEAIETRSSHATADLRQLWRRIVFSILISNTDDHLRNHGFLHEDGDTWRLSPAFDVNPNPEPGAKHLSTAIDLGDDTASISLALSVADYFRLSAEEANDVVGQVQTAVSHWAPVARQYGLSSQEVTAMSWAFHAHAARAST
jgi:hypothetical protein